MHCVPIFNHGKISFDASRDGKSQIFRNLKSVPVKVQSPWKCLDLGTKTSYQIGLK